MPSPPRPSRPGLAGLLEAGYPLSEEQTAAIRSAAGSEGRVAIIEGAAGSGKTTTLRPIADLYREHGRSIIATAVAWRTAVALGNDVDARPFCVDKLLRLAARGALAIDRDTAIIVDEAGMLSTRQAHHILRLSERHGAKIVFAGDTQQQQPVEAGPGLRLIRDAVGSVRVDRIRRQKADLEDILVHVHGETPQAARLRAGFDGRTGKHPHCRRLRGHGRQARLHPVAGGGVDGAARRRCGRRHRGPSRPGAVPYRP